jgi:hypothetical protein
MFVTVTRWRIFFAVRSQFSGCYDDDHPKINIPLSQAFTAYHPKIFTVIISLSEGRPGIAWDSSNDNMFFLPA